MPPLTDVDKLAAASFALNVSSATSNGSSGPTPAPGAGGSSSPAPASTPHPQPVQMNLQQFISKYNIQVTGSLTVKFNLNGSSPSDFLADAAKAMEGNPLSTDLLQVLRKSGVFDARQSGDIEITSSIPHSNLKSFKERKAEIDVSTLEASLAHVAYRAVKGKDLFNGNIVQTSDGHPLDFSESSVTDAWRRAPGVYITNLDPLWSWPLLGRSSAAVREQRIYSIKKV